MVDDDEQFDGIDDFYAEDYVEEKLPESVPEKQSKPGKEKDTNPWITVAITIALVLTVSIIVLMSQEDEYQDQYHFNQEENAIVFFTKGNPTTWQDWTIDTQAQLDKTNITILYAMGEKLPTTRNCEATGNTVTTLIPPELVSQKCPTTTEEEGYHPIEFPELQQINSNNLSNISSVALYFCAVQINHIDYGEPHPTAVEDVSILLKHKLKHRESQIFHFETLPACETPKTAE